MTTDVCWTCGGAHDAAHRFCARCGSGVGGAWALLAIAPAAATGTVGALLTLTASLFVRTPARPVGIIEGIEAVALNTTLPHFDVAMGAVAGWAAVSTLRVRSVGPVLLAGAATTLLYVAALLIVSQATGRAVVSHEWAWVLLAPSLGAAFAGALAARLGGATGLGPFLNRFSRVRLPLTAVLTVLSVGALVVLYGLVLAAVAAALALIALVFALRLAGSIFSTSGPQTRRVYVSGDGEETERSTRAVQPAFGAEYVETRDQHGAVVGTSHRVETMFGGARIERRDADGNVIGSVREVRPLFGEPHVEYRDGDGNVVGTEHLRDPLLGDKFIEHRDADGRVVGSVHQGESLFGGKYIEHRDGDGAVVGTVHRKEPIFGEAYVQERDAQGNVIAETRRVEPLFGEAYIERKEVKR